MITDRSAVFAALQARGLAEVTKMVGHHFGRLHGVSIDEFREASNIKTRETLIIIEQVATYGKLTDSSAYSIPVATGFTTDKKKP